MNIFKRYNLLIKCLFVIIIMLLALIYAYPRIVEKKPIVIKDGKIKIGLSIDSLVVERWQYDRDIFLAKAKELGADIIVQNASGNSNEQINQIKFLIDQNVDVLVIIPNDSDALAPVVGIAKKKGIKVISYDRLIMKADTDLYVCFDNKKVGELMGRAIAKKVPKGNYVIINGNDRDNNAILFNQGYKGVLKPYINSGEINIVKEVWARGWNEEIAYKCVEDVIDSGKKIDAIICGNDRLAEAAIQILSEHRLAGKVAVVGGDASLAGCQRIAEGIQLMTVYKPIKTLAQNAAEAAVAMAKGKKVTTKLTMKDGEYEVPIIMEPSISVDNKNMYEVIVKSNFHRLEDIYRNIPRNKWPKVR